MKKPAVFVYVDTPSLRELKKRLRKRGTETEKSMKTREDEFWFINRYSHHCDLVDVIITNDDYERCYRDFKELLVTGIAVTNIQQYDLSRRGIRDLWVWYHHSRRKNRIVIAPRSKWRKVFRGMHFSKWRSRFTRQEHGKNFLDLYEKSVLEEKFNDLPELIGKELGCWCILDDPEPEPCHGILLRNLVYKTCFEAYWPKESPETQ